MRHTPNILSCFRVLLLPLFVWRVWMNGWIAAAGVLAVSGLTDLLDGFLARRFGWVSALGKVLDPAADKLTQVTVCIMLAIKMPDYWYFFSLLLGKEAAMLLLGGWLLRKKVRIEGARWFGKIVTTLFYLTMIALLFFYPVPHWVVLIMLSLITVFAFCAGIMYIPQFLRYRMQAQNPPPPLPGEGPAAGRGRVDLR